MQNWILNILLSILTSFVASVVFLLFGSIIGNPKIKISNKIAKLKENNKTVYKIKIINKTSRPIFNIKAEWSIISYRSTARGKDKKYIPITFDGVSNPMQIDKFEKHPNNNTDYTFRFSTVEDIEKLLNKEGEGSQLIFRIYASDSLFGFATIVNEYYQIKDIKEGDFAYGNSFKVE
jgi:hypothetical protein